MPGQGRTFRRHVEKFWKIWALPEIVDEIHRVVYVDGIYLAKNTVILIATSDEYVLSWYLAKAETSYAYKQLLSRIAPPDMVITDGGSGFAKAVKEVWPTTKVQRCLFHVFCQVKRETTTRPKLLAGKELYKLAKELLDIDCLKDAQWWIERFLQWCEFWYDFLDEKSIINGKKEYTHARLRKARRGLVKLINQKTLFTYLDPELTVEEPLPKTNNRIEGGVNAQLRAVLRNHRGLSKVKRIKAVFWWCYMHTECPKGATELLKDMPTDDDIDELRNFISPKVIDKDIPQWGDGIVWEEFHHRTKYWDYDS